MSANGLRCLDCGAVSHYPAPLDGKCRWCVDGVLGGDYADFIRWERFANLWLSVGRVAAKRPLRHEPNGRAA